MAIKFNDDHPLKAGQYVSEKTAKTHVVWHGTMGRTRYTPHNGKPGQATTSIDSWNNDDLGRVGATYLLDRDGTIYRCFDEQFWIYHLGLKNTNGKWDRTSVGIELANELGLMKEGERYYAFEKVTKNTEYVGPVFKRTWRERDYWAQLDEAQVDKAIELTLDICDRNNIKPSFFQPSTRHDYPGCFERATIICHSNCRRDKTDLIVEDWVWTKIKAAGIAIVS